MLGAPVSELNFRTHGGQEPARGLDVAHLRDIFEDDRFFGEQSGGHGGQGRVFSAADANRSQQWIAAANYEFIHIDIVRCEGVTLSIVKVKCVSAGGELVNRKGTACWRYGTFSRGKKSSFARPSGRDAGATKSALQRSGGGDGLADVSLGGF